MSAKKGIFSGFFLIFIFLASNREIGCENIVNGHFRPFLAILTPWPLGGKKWAKSAKIEDYFFQNFIPRKRSVARLFLFDFLKEKCFTLKNHSSEIFFSWPGRNVPYDFDRLFSKFWLFGTFWRFLANSVENYQIILKKVFNRL